MKDRFVRLLSIVRLILFIISIWGFHPWALRTTALSRKDEEPQEDETLTLDLFQNAPEILGARRNI
jgi:hypothetical protein